MGALLAIVAALALLAGRGGRSPSDGGGSTGGGSTGAPAEPAESESATFWTERDIPAPTASGFADLTPPAWPLSVVVARVPGDPSSYTATEPADGRDRSDPAGRWPADGVPGVPTWADEALAAHGLRAMMPADDGAFRTVHVARIFPDGVRRVYRTRTKPRATDDASPTGGRVERPAHKTGATLGSAPADRFDGLGRLDIAASIRPGDE